MNLGQPSSRDGTRRDPRELAALALTAVRMTARALDVRPRGSSPRCCSSVPPSRTSPPSRHGAGSRVERVGGLRPQLQPAYVR